MHGHYNKLQSTETVDNMQFIELESLPFFLEEGKYRPGKGEKILKFGIVTKLEELLVKSLRAILPLFNQLLTSERVYVLDYVTSIYKEHPDMIVRQRFRNDLTLPKHEGKFNNNLI